jgi:hypothetical protein
MQQPHYCVVNIVALDERQKKKLAVVHVSTAIPGTLARATKST